MDRSNTPRNNATDDPRPPGSSSPLNPPGPSGFRSTGGLGLSSSREIPGVNPNVLNSANSLSVVKMSKGVPRWAVVATALLATAALMALFVMLKGESNAMADTDSSRTNTKVSSSHSLPDGFQQKERAAVRAKGLTTDNYIPSVSEEGRELISRIPTYANTGCMLSPAGAEVKTHPFMGFSCPMYTRLWVQSMERLKELAKSRRIRLVWHNFVIFEQYGPDKPARAALAAVKQGKLFELADAAYKDLASPQDHARYTDVPVRTVAEKVGLDMAKSKADYAPSEVTQETLAEQQLAQGLGLSGIPAIMVGDVYLPGVASTQIIKNTIELQAREQ